ncbi:hypothetical protein M407DRAFT_177163 [Tulasnella calospora MUT 4182]|uniref:Uncharacterized protein n=1 Tax=Tulasnella calospora MUT 4182 TaxID=1051891 RepID=A0A0C3PR24_9AGAM|nr:hypothetical protein M407DRAFT_177163 [Tulasnella calospora MUT 4182]
MEQAESTFKKSKRRDNEQARLRRVYVKEGREGIEELRWVVVLDDGEWEKFDCEGIHGPIAAPSHKENGIWSMTVRARRVCETWKLSTIQIQFLRPLKAVGANATDARFGGVLPNGWS